MINRHNILHVVASLNPENGGVSQAIATIIQALSLEAVQNEVVCQDQPQAAYLQNRTFMINGLGPGIKPWGYNQKLAPWLKNNLNRFDIVIIHGLWLYPSYATTAAKSHLDKKNGVSPKCFVMPHGMLDPYFQKASGRKFKALRNWLFWKIIEKRVIQKADGLLFTSEMEKTLARQSFTPFQPKKEWVIGLGVVQPPSANAAMAEAFREKIAGISNKPYWLFLSRIHEKKGVDLLIKAYMNINRLYPKIPPLVIAGPGLETDFGKQMKVLASACPDIHFTGMLEGNAKWGAFYGCETFVLTSHQENFGIAVAEALACGKPVLISDKVNIWKEIESEEAGIIGNDTIEGTERTLFTWKNLPLEKKYQMGKQAYQAFKKHFENSSAASRLMNAL